MKIKNTKVEKKELEGQCPKGFILLNPIYFKHIRSRNLAKAPVGPVSNQGIEGIFREDIVGKLSKRFPSAFPVEKHRKDSPKDPFSLQDLSEGLAHVELLEECGTKTRDEKFLIRMI